MPRALLAVPFAVGLFIGCTSDSVGKPCESDADCNSGLICDFHDGQGTCQEEHDHGEGETHDTHDTHGETHGETGDTDHSVCEAETRDDEFAIGLSKSGASFTATFISADPAPPIKGNNTWVLSITDAGGMPLDNPTIVVTPMMPDHGHGTPVEAVVTATDNPGEFSISPVNLFMTGYWEVTLDITAGETQDAVMFGFCVE